MHVGAPARNTQQAVVLVAQSIAAHPHRHPVVHIAAAVAAAAVYRKDEACIARAQAQRQSGSIRRDGRTGRRIWVLVEEAGTARSGRAGWVQGWGRIELGRVGRRMVVGGGDVGEVEGRQARLRRRHGSEEGSVRGARRTPVQGRAQARSKREWEVVLAQRSLHVRCARNSGRCGSGLLVGPVHRNERAPAPPSLDSCHQIRSGSEGVGPQDWHMLERSAGQEEHIVRKAAAQAYAMGLG